MALAVQATEYHWSVVMKIYLASSAPTGEKYKMLSIHNRLLSFWSIKTKAWRDHTTLERIKSIKESSHENQQSRIAESP